MRYEGLFTPPDLKGTLMLPGTRGGAEWGGAAYDPTTSVLYIKSNDSPEIQSMQKVDLAKEAKDQTAFDQGRTLYMTYCVSCHGKDKNGDEPTNPSLIGPAKPHDSRGRFNKNQTGWRKNARVCQRCQRERAGHYCFFVRPGKEFG
jgi:quinoprotein glucose dehydrogenase